MARKRKSKSVIKGENSSVQISFTDELINSFIPKYIFDCPIDDDNSIDLTDLDIYLASQEEIYNAVKALPVMNDSGDFGVVFEKMTDEDIVKVCSFLFKKYNVTVNGLDYLNNYGEHGEPLDLDNEDYFGFNHEEEGYDDFNVEEYFKSNKGSRIKKEEQVNITAQFCSDINLKSVPMDSNEETQIFKDWEHGNQVYLLGIAGTPVLIDHLLSTIENSNNEDTDEDDYEDNEFPKDKDKQYTKGLKIVIKGLEEESFSETERTEIEKLTKQASHSNIANIAEEAKFMKIAKEMFGLNVPTE